MHLTTVRYLIKALLNESQFIENFLLKCGYLMSCLETDDISIGAVMLESNEILVQ
jgi:hypothetical protein